jgi:hypothetical protein
MTSADIFSPPGGGGYFPIYRPLERGDENGDERTRKYEYGKEARQMLILN